MCQNAIVRPSFLVADNGVIKQMSPIIPDDAITEWKGQYGFLSNYCSCKVEYDGGVYPTVEHAYQAAKSLDPLYRDKIKALKNPQWAKNAGSRVQVREDWFDMSMDTMQSLLRQKFAQPKFREKLIASGDRMLVEGNHWDDTFWGMCQVAKGLWEGENRLGNLIMQIRDEVKVGGPT